MWKQRYYFRSGHKDHENEIFCMKCRNFSRKWIKGGKQSHVEQHEKAWHGGSDETATSGGGGGTQQLKLDQTIAYPGEQQARLIAKLVGFLIRDAPAAALTLGVGFREFVLALNSRFRMPGLNTIRKYTRAMAEAAREQLLTYIQPLKEKGPVALRGMAACLSLDLWTDNTQKKFLGVLLHTIKETEDGYEQKEFCLACKEVDETHITAEVVKKYVDDVLKDFGLPVKCIFRVVHDGDAKVIKGVRDAGLPSSLCFIHSLQRTIAVAFKGAEPVVEVLTRTKKAVTGARQSNVQASYLRRAQESVGAPQRALIQDNQTRWGSTHDMAERTTEQRAAFQAAYQIDDAFNRGAKKVFDLEKRLQLEDIDILAQVVAVFKPFRAVTRELQSAGVTSSFVAPSFSTLLGVVDILGEIVVEMPFAGSNYPATSATTPVSELHPSMRKVVNQARADMVKRFELKRMLPHAVATLLDPRVMSLQAFEVARDLSEKAWSVIHQQLDQTITALKEAERYGKEERGEKRDADGQPKAASFLAGLNAKAKQCNDMPAGALPAGVGPGLDDALNFGDVVLKNPVDVASEITKYLSTGTQDMSSGALEVWGRLRKDCPALAIVAMHYLCIPASSSAVERLFSQTGLIKSKLRNRLLPRTLQDLIFTRANWNDSLYDVRPKKKTAGGVEESKGGEEEEEDEDDEDGEALWAALEEEIAGGDRGIFPEDDLGLEELMGWNYDEPSEEFWAQFGEEEEPSLGMTMTEGLMRE